MNLTKSFEILLKGRSYGVGAIRTWANGKQYKKQADGKWVEYIKASEKPVMADTHDEVKHKEISDIAKEMYKTQIEAISKDVEEKLLEYKEDSSFSPSHRKTIEKSLEFLKQKNYQGLYNAFTEGGRDGISFEIKLTYEKVKKLKVNDYIDKTFGLDWGMQAGEYDVYRAGASESQRGLFFSMDKAGADAYSDSENPTKKYKVTIGNPLVSTDVISLLSELTGNPKSFYIKQRDKVGDNEKWWRSVDKKAMELAKKKGYDSILYYEPAPPAVRELVVFSNKFVEK